MYITWPIVCPVVDIDVTDADNVPNTLNVAVCAYLSVVTHWPPAVVRFV